MARKPTIIHPMTPRGRRRHNPMLRGRFTQAYRDELKRNLHSEDPYVRGRAAQEFLAYQKAGGNIKEFVQYLQSQRTK